MIIKHLDYCKWRLYITNFLQKFELEQKHFSCKYWLIDTSTHYSIYNSSKCYYLINEIFQTLVTSQMFNFKINTCSRKLELILPSYEDSDSFDSAALWSKIIHFIIASTWCQVKYIFQVILFPISWPEGTLITATLKADEI